MSNKLVVITGPREGVGKTTLAVNIAAAYAQARHQPVLLLDTDSFCRGEVAVLGGCSASTNVVQVVDQLVTKQTTLPMLRGRFPLNRLNIALLPLAATTREADQLTVDQWQFFLQSFLSLYDLVVDIEPNHPLRMASIDLADRVVWTLKPDHLCVRSSVQQWQAIQGQKQGFQKFSLVVNQTGLPNSLSTESIENAFAPFDHEIEASVPFDPEISHLLNEGRPVIITQTRQAFYRALMPVLDKIATQSRGPSASTLSGSRSPSAVVTRGAAVLDNMVVDKMLAEKQVRWGGFKQRIHRELIEELNIRRIDLDTKGDPTKERQLRTNVESTVNALIGKEKDLNLNRDDRERLVKELVDEALGLGPLEELLADPSITEIMVNRFDQVFVERKGKIVLSDKRFIDNNHIVQVIRRIIAPLGRRIDESVPMVDARLRDGSRVNAIIPPLAVQGPTLTIRRFPEKAFAPRDLVAMNSISPEMVEFLRICVLTKKNMLISGGTGTGKTTILNMLSSFIPNDERIVTVEDTAELRLQQEHIVRLEARPANIEGQGQVTIRDLVKNCLRMRPDRIVVGECRGGEALDMLQAMNTGHDGSLTTIHANTPRDAFTRLETLCLMAGMDLPVWALREQIRSAVQIVIQLSRLQDGSRRVTSVTEVTGRDNESIKTQDLFTFTQTHVDATGRVHGTHEATGALPVFFPDLKAKGLLMDPGMFQKKVA